MSLSHVGRTLDSRGCVGWLGDMAVLAAAVSFGWSVSGAVIGLWWVQVLAYRPAARGVYP